MYAHIHIRTHLHTYLSRAWADEVDARFTQRQEALEAELNISRSNLVKESIRRGYVALGDLLFSRGDTQEAFRQHLRSRDYCTTPQQTVQMCLSVVRCALVMKNYLHVGTYVQKAEALPSDDVDVEALAKLRAALGVALMCQGKYKAAARAFTSLPLDIGSSYSDVIASADVATYGTLTALATLDRSEVSTRILDSSTFREMMGHAGAEVRDMATDFQSSRYGTALAALARLTPYLRVVDPYVAEHADALIASVRSRALTLYTKPFAVLDLAQMAVTFNTDAETLQRELISLIASKEISGFRIDAHANVLVSQAIDPRASTYQAVLAAAEGYERGTKMLLLRAGMMRYDMVQRSVGGGVERPERPDRPERPERREREGGGGGHSSRGHPRASNRERERGGSGGGVGGDTSRGERRRSTMLSMLRSGGGGAGGGGGEDLDAMMAFLDEGSGGLSAGDNGMNVD